MNTSHSVKYTIMRRGNKSFAKLLANAMILVSHLGTSNAHRALKNMAMLVVFLVAFVVGAEAQSHTIANGQNETVNTNTTWSSLTIAGGNKNSSLTIKNGTTLTITGNLTINAPTQGDKPKYIVVESGAKLIVNGNINMANTNGTSRDIYIQISDNAEVTVGGNITMNGDANRNFFYFSGNGTLNVGGMMSGGCITGNVAGGAANPGKGTVNFTSTSNQTIPNYTYYNLTTSGGGTYTLSTITTVNGTLKLESGVLNTNGNNLTISKSECGSGTITSTSTVTYNDACTSLIAGTYNKLNLNGTTAMTTCGNVTVNGTTTIGAGKNISTAYDIVFNAISGTGAATTTINATAGTVSYNNATTNILAGTYNNLNLVGGNRVVAGDVTVNGTFTWPSGRINLYNGDNNYNFTLGPNATISSTNPFSESHMFVFAKSSTVGFVTVNGDAARFANFVFPVGNVNGTSYTYRPLTISGATVDGQGYVSVRPTNAKSGKENTTDLQCYWTTESDKVTNAKLVCQFVTADDTDNELFPYHSNGGFEWSKWSVSGSEFNRANKTITFEKCTPSGSWSACEDVKTYYSFTSGYWNSKESWTFDPAGQDRNGSNIPATAPTEADRVVILNGNTITINTNATKCLSLQIYSGGTLDLGATKDHNFGKVTGQGLMRINSSNYFPGGNYASNFVAANGGTIEYYGNIDITLPTNHTTYNNLIINLSAGRKATLASDLTINGDFTIQQGTFQIGNNATGRTIVVEGDLTVASAGSITTGITSVNTQTGSYGVYTNKTVYGHKLELKGDFTNNGSVDFTNRNAADYTNYFSNTVTVFVTNGTKDQSIKANGVTKFYSIRVDKGIDKTYILNIDASSSDKFFLYGPRTGWTYDKSSYTTSQYFLALALVNGTTRLGSNITIDALMSSDGSYGYKIDETVCLWIDGANVTTNSCFAFYLHGDMKMTNSNSRCVINAGQGIVFRTTANITIDDGYITSGRLRTSQAAGTHIGAFTINGGTAEFTGSNDDKQNHPTFGLTYESNGFNMSGGNLIVHRGTQGNGKGTKRAIVIGAKPENCEITGGTVTVYAERWNSGTAWPANINSTAPFWNLVLDGTDGTEIVNFEGGDGSAAVAAQPLVVLNNLTIQNNGKLTANNQNVYVGGNFIINSGCTYTPGNNTTVFNGNGSIQDFTCNGTITNNLNNMVIDNGAYLRLQSDIATRANFTMETGSTFADNQHTLTVNGNIVNNGTHYNSNSAAGCILLGGSSAQTISGDGNGKFNNLHINKTGGSVDLSSNIEVTGYLRLISNHILNIGANNLNLSDDDATIYSDAATGTNFSVNKMIKTSGLYSDGGITKRYSSTDKFLFPFGFGSYYTPSEIQFDVEPTTYGSVTTRPVSSRHYVLTDGADALTCYWHNTSDGFSGVTSVNHYYYYNSNNLVQTLANENKYVPTYYYGGQWFPNNNTSLVDENNNKFRWESCPVVDGDFTCGSPAVFSQAPARLYSSSTPGNWNDANSWSATEVGGAGGAGVPGANTVVVIGDASHHHTITTTTSAFSGSISIAEGSMLDLGKTQGHNFGLLPNGNIDGNGTLRISSSNYFPNGDFGSFLGAGGGTVEYYANGNNITIPATKTNYYNLKLTAGLNGTGTNYGYYCAMPNVDLHVYGNLYSEGGNDGNYNRFNNGNGNRTLTIDGDLIVEAGQTIQTGAMKFSGERTGSWRNYTYYTQNVIVKGSVIVGANASLSTYNNNYDVTNNLTIYGNMECDGTIDFDNHEYVATTFAGTRNDTIKGAGTISLYTLTCDKGTDATPILSVEKNITAQYVGGAFLTLLNGTFQANGDDVNINITQAANFTIGSTACLSTKRGTFNVCNSTSNSYDLYLNGKLEVLGGTMNIGTGNYGNDIEYAAGQPTIDVQGGSLNVRGQIRRSTSITTGDLQYLQSDGAVTIFGNSRNNSRALLEVTNNGTFNISGGTLQFVNGAGSTEQYGDILINSTNYSATGGTIQIGTNASTSGQTFNMNAGTSVFNVTVGTESNAQTLQFITSAIDMNGSLTINRGSKVYVNSNNLNIAGDFITYNANGYYYYTGTTQTTTFDGTGLQKIIGIGASASTVPKLKFNKLTFDNPSTVQLQNVTITSENTLTINRGTVDDAGNKIIAKSNVVNDGKHISSLSGGCLSFEGSGATQYVSSSAAMLSSGNSRASFGNVLVGNYTEMNNAIEITGDLTLNANLYANDYSLHLSQSATINDASTYMIVLNGAIGDAGITKYFADGFTGSFTFRIGVSDNCTPVTYTFSSLTSNNGYINVKPLNYRHPLISPATPPTDCLNYYWMITTSGLNNISANVGFAYTDNLLVDGGNESSMIGQRYGESQWHHYPYETTVDADANSFTIAGIDNLNGDFTCGFPAFSQLPVYYSKTSGNWNDKTSWQYLDAGGNWQPADYAPSGNPVIIQNGHTISMVGSSTYCAYSVTIEEGGKLDVGNTVGHNLGIVRGGGILSVGEIDNGSGMYSFKVPAGEYAEFYNNPLSTIEFYGDHTSNLPAKPGNYYNPFQNVIFKGNGTKNITTAQFYAKGNVTIEDGCHIDNSISNRDFYVGGNFTDLNTSGPGYICGTSIVRLVGTSLQTIDVRNDEKFYNLQINNPAGVDVTNNGAANNNLIVANMLYLTNGVVHTADNSLISITNTNANAVNGGSATSFVDGPLRKNISNSGSFKFPVGAGTRLGYITLSNVNNNGASAKYWTAEYKNDNPNDVCSNIDATLTAISDNEYWIVKRPDAASNAKVGLRWDDQSCSMFTSLALLKQRLSVVEYDGASIWNVRQATADGSLTAGTITTNSAVTSDNYYFTFGYSGVIAEITTTTNQAICNDGVQTASIDVALYGTAPFTLKYTIDGHEFTQSNINASTYTITRNSAQLGGVVGTYSVGLVSVRDASSDGVVKLATGSIEVLTAYTPTFVDGTGSGVAGWNETRIYTVESHAGSTYKWTCDSDRPTLTNDMTNSLTVKYPSTNIFTNSYTLTIVETSSTGCAMTTSLTINMSENPQPSFEAETNICEGDVVTYTTASVEGHSYQWSIDGSNISGAKGNSYTRTWSTPGTYTLKVKESYMALSGNMEKTITVYAKPTRQALSDIADICSGNSATVNVGSTESNTTYKLYKEDGSNAGNTLSGDGSAKSFTTNVMNVAGTYKLYATAKNQGCEVRMPETGYKTLTVYETPAITYTMPDLYLGTPADLTYIVTSTAVPTSYSINYTTGGTNVPSTSLGAITFVPTSESQVAGSFTIVTNDNCPASYNFDEAVIEGYVWSGNNNTIWENAANWFSGNVPTSSNSAIIRSSANMPTISATANAKSVVIESGTLTISGTNQLNVYGDWTTNVGANFKSNSSVVAFMNDATINGQTTFNSISVASSKVLNLGSGTNTVAGDIINNGEINGGTGTLTLQGGEANSLSGTGTYNLNNLTVDNASGASLQCELTVNGILALANGALSTNGNLITLGATATATSTGTDAYVNGQIRKNDIAANSEFVFPIGNNGRRGMIGIKPVSAGSFTVGYTYTADADGDKIENKAESLLAVSQIDNWDVVCNSSPSVSSYISLYWDNATTSEINDPSSMVVAHYNSSTSTWENMGGSASSSGSGGKVTCTVPFSSYSPVAFGSSSLVNPLPITLVNFDAKQNGNAVEVSWTTLSEFNNDRFEIERSTDGVNFTVISVVNGANVSNIRIDYTYTDNNPEFGYQYYRLRQVDFDGQSTYSDKIVCVKFVNNDEENYLTIEPNPTNDKFSVEVNSAIADGNYTLFAQSGQIVKQGSVAGSTDVIDISNLPQGIYILQYTSNNVVLTRKVVKL